MPQAYRDGTETLSYSLRLNTGFAPRNYKKDPAACRTPLLLITGTAVESFVSREFPPLLEQFCPDAEVRLLGGVSHMGVVTGPDIRKPVADFLRMLGGST